MKVFAGVKLAIVGTMSLVFLAGCGGGAGNNPNNAPPTPTPNTTPPSGVIVVPPHVSVAPGGVSGFSVMVTPSGANPAVTWSVSGPGCSGANCGTIDAHGKYIAPATVPSPATVIVSATSVVDATIAGTTTIAIKTELQPVSVAVAPDPSGKFGEFAYVANFGSDNVSMYTIDTTTGNLEAVGTIAAGGAPDSVAVDPSGQFVYVANSGSDNVSMYTIDATTGILQSIGTIGAGIETGSVVVHPSGNFAYVASFGNEDLGTPPGTVSMYRINATTGALTSIGTIAEASVGTASIAVHPSGNFAYVVNSGFSNSNTISMYTINSTTGALTSIGNVAAQNPNYIAVHPSGNFAYVVSVGSNTISTYTINSTTGALTSIGTVATEKAPESFAIDPSGKFA
jgi:YVTN family beta-propeller protein